MYSIMFVLYRKPGMDQDDFVRHWRERHAPLVAQLPGILRYRIAPVVREEAAEAPFAGIAEIWFESRDAWLRALESPEGQRALQDVLEFQERSDGASMAPEIVFEAAFGEGGVAPTVPQA